MRAHMAAGRDPFPLAEYFVKIEPSRSSITARMPAEFPVVDRFAPVDVPDGATVLATVNVGFQDYPAIVELADGTVVCGLGRETSALRHPELRLLSERAARRTERGGAR